MGVTPPRRVRLYRFASRLAESSSGRAHRGSERVSTRPQCRRLPSFSRSRAPRSSADLAPKPRLTSAPIRTTSHRSTCPMKNAKHLGFTTVFPGMAAAKSRLSSDPATATTQFDDELSNQPTPRMIRLQSKVFPLNSPLATPTCSIGSCATLPAFHRPPRSPSAVKALFSLDPRSHERRILSARAFAGPGTRLASFGAVRHRRRMTGGD
jgi:hypothetical protein